MKNRYTIEGMTCGHCEKAVKTALESIPGVQSVLVSLSGKYAEVEGDATVEAMQNAIAEEGYILKP